jgi:hypothetical protein
MPTSDQKTDIPRVPLQTPMFNEDVNSDGTLTRTLSRTWIIFFERIWKQNKATSTVTTDSGDKFDRYVFGLGVGANIAVGSSATPKITCERKTQLTHWRITANTAPTGSSIIVDIKKNGVSIFPAGTANEVVLPATLLKAQGTTFVAAKTICNVGDELLPDVIQVGSTIPGFRIQVQIVGLVVT